MFFKAAIIHSLCAQTQQPSTEIFTIYGPFNIFYIKKPLYRKWRYFLIENQHKESDAQTHGEKKNKIKSCAVYNLEGKH